MTKPNRSDSKYWTGTRGFDEIAFIDDLYDYIYRLEGEIHSLKEFADSGQGDKALNVKSEQWIDVINKLENKQMSKETTIREQRVRSTFNPSLEGAVDLIKQRTADLINMCEELKSKDGRLASLAQTAYEEAAMWAVKAATS